MNVEKMQKKIYRTAFDHGWHKEQRTFGDVIALMHSELSEALEEFRNGRDLNEIYYKHEKDCGEMLGVSSCNCMSVKPEGIPIELADVIIRILDFCGAERIDMEGAIIEKMAFNETRSHRHGGKKL